MSELGPCQHKGCKKDANVSLEGAGQRIALCDQHWKESVDRLMKMDAKKIRALARANL